MDGDRPRFDEIIVLNVHVHTTEAYDVDGVRYRAGRRWRRTGFNSGASIKVPADYPPDLYWRGAPPVEEYNYVRVDVDPTQKTRFWVTRWRPGAAAPFEPWSCFRRASSRPRQRAGDQGGVPSVSRIVTPRTSLMLTVVPIGAISIGLVKP